MEKISVSSLQRVLRVIQLDSAVLDEEVLHLLQSQLKSVFKYIQGTAVDWQPELNLLIRCLVWRFTVYKNSATIGQSLFNVKYVIQTNQGYHPLTLKYKLIIGAVYVGRHWLYERIDDLMTNITQYEISQKIRKILKLSENIWQLASVVNFLIFLQHGEYASLFERLLGLRHVYASRQKIQKLNYDFMNRELLWHGCMELIAFIIPLINIQRLRNFVKNITTSSRMQQVDAQDKRHNRERNSSELCPICDQKPIHPQTIDNCGHVYCYYCIKANCMADPSFRCNVCNVKVDDKITPLIG
eukprot:gene15233-16807_t